MYVYKFSYVNYDDFISLVLQSKIKYTKNQLYDILYALLHKIYQEEEFPPLPCLLNWGEVFFLMDEEPYKSWLRKEYFLVPFGFDCTINTSSGPDVEQIDNIRCCHKDYADGDDCIHSKHYCKWRDKNG